MTTTAVRRHAADCLPSPEAHTIAAPVAATVATTLKAMADPLRLRMLAMIATSPGGEACVCDLSEVAAGVTQPTVSHHLKVLKDVGVLTSQRRGTWVYYRITPEFGPAVRSLLETFVPAARDAADEPRELTELADVDRDLTAVADELAGRHPDLPASQVLQTVRESYTGLARNATTRPSLVPLTRRFAEQRLVDLEAVVEAAPRPPQVLFVCVANAGRSQLAAALVQHYAGDRVVARSAGSAPAGRVHATVRPLLDDLGADEAYPKPLTDDAVRAADLVVTMGCGDVCPIVPGVRYEDWIVGDPAVASPEGVAAIHAEIEQRVRALLADLVPDLPLPGPESQPLTARPTEETSR